MQMAPSGGEICNECKWRHLVAKFATNASGAMLLPNLVKLQSQFLGLLCLWQCFFYWHLNLSFRTIQSIVFGCPGSCTYLGGRWMIQSMTATLEFQTTNGQWPWPWTPWPWPVTMPTTQITLTTPTLTLTMAPTVTQRAQSCDVRAVSHYCNDTVTKSSPFLRVVRCRCWYQWRKEEEEEERFHPSHSEMCQQLELKAVWTFWNDF